jgi:hypothetical protein
MFQELLLDEPWPSQGSKAHSAGQTVNRPSAAHPTGINVNTCLLPCFSFARVPWSRCWASACQHSCPCWRAHPVSSRTHVALDSSLMHLGSWAWPTWGHFTLMVFNPQCGFKTSLLHSAHLLQQWLCWTHILQDALFCLHSPPALSESGIEEWSYQVLVLARRAWIFSNGKQTTRGLSCSHLEVRDRLQASQVQCSGQ